MVEASEANYLFAEQVLKNGMNGEMFCVPVQKC